MNDPVKPDAVTRRWDIFCSVVDNFGDIGICWRLARQLVNEYGQAVRLWVDDLRSFRRIAPEVDPASPQQVCRGVEVRPWPVPFPAVAPEQVADVVVEAFACTLPDNFVEAMAARTKAPLWINLEHLSAEPWVAGCHALPSPHPRLPLTKYFFFPGFEPGTGGLLRERDLLQRRRAFQADSVAQAAFWAQLGLSPAVSGELRVSLFAYSGDDLAALLDVWAGGEQAICVLVPEGHVAGQLAALFGAGAVRPGDRFERGFLTVQVLPFLEQDRYDRLLWACDINFVRGEDSFVRAQWAGRPLVWQIYRQEEGAHWPKLEAFLALYQEGLPAAAAAALVAFWQAWNREQGTAGTWADFLAWREVLERHAGAWEARMTALGDVAENLMLFCTKAI